MRRADGREASQLRPFSSGIGVCASAEGSASFKLGMLIVMEIKMMQVVDSFIIYHTEAKFNHYTLLFSCIRIRQEKQLLLGLLLVQGLRDPRKWNYLIVPSYRVLSLRVLLFTSKKVSLNRMCSSMLQ